MEVILLERVAKLGQMGDVVKVKDGYARNFLLPRNKALRATEANKSKFAAERAQLARAGQPDAPAGAGDQGHLAIQTPARCSHATTSIQGIRPA